MRENSNKPSTSTFSIGDLSREFGITTRTIRHYEDIGLLSPTRTGKTRIYSASDKTRLKLILRGKRLGFSLEQSREIIDMYDPAQGNKEQLKKLLHSLQQQQKRLQQQRDDINNMILDLKQAEADCLSALEQETTTA